MTTPTTSEAFSVEQGFETNDTIQLIDGNFSAQDAQEVLMDLINHKIRFHQLRNISWEERFGEPNQHSQKRLKELMKDRDRLSAVLDFAAQHGLNIKLQSKIDILLSK